jgi:putative methyltransferase (TIGR01177 family)
MPINTRYFCIVGGKYPKLAREEITALLKTYGHLKIEHSMDNLVVAQGECKINKVAQRAVYTKSIAREIQTEEDYSVLRGKTFSCFGTNDVELRKRVVEDIKKKTGAKVLLENPDCQIVIVSKSTGNNSSASFTNLIGIRIPQPRIDWTKRLSQRKFLHPSMLEPRLCRAMVNLAQVKEGDTIVDPFCGTGGILVEAQELNIRTAGYDIQKKMCLGTKQNMVENIAICDSLHIPLKPFVADAIITDIPYGRSTKIIRGQTRQQILKDLIDNPIVHKMVILCQKDDDEEMIMKSRTNLKSSICHLYRHKSLTRSMVTIMTW